MATASAGRSAGAAGAGRNAAVARSAPAAIALLLVLAAGSAGAADDATSATLRASCAPDSLQAIVREGAHTREQAALVPLLAGRSTRAGRTTAYVCENRLCRYPTTEPEEFAAQLRPEEVADSKPRPARARSGPAFR